ncbi:RagB/SusD family nutrient uptake outer membrane protein [Olivibacter sp. SDN3]|uniref:RagB/SusD family nutrient uptake outer membrane protein n=1 Tax=Olivibacter sp. SDN3 TaxID=2764720 RepID=UPI001651347D|nr:RagB/SusD family nutrient uptake outer membrane protein [Olivibacter sp. SDN3]QNL51907.1 RagB/SusD family nutrient uptake outer membrane protein [Olivibacter sp. SDN3]
MNTIYQNSKRLYFRGLLFFLLTLSVSCSKNFIDLAPESTTTTDLLYQTDSHFQDAVNACYTAMQEQYQNFWIFADVPGEDVAQEVVKNDAWYFADAFTMPDNVEMLHDTWSNYYVVINRANIILEKIEEADESLLQSKDRHIGEAKFLRAMAYFDLVRIFGGVPLITQTLAPHDAYAIGRTDVQQVYNELIIPDLLDAAARLPRSYSGTHIGRATSGAALAMLGRVYLTTGDFVNAELTLQEVTTMGYALLPHFEDLYDYGLDEHHSEYIFDIEYEEGLGNQGSVFTHRFMPNSSAMADFYDIRGGELSETFSPTDQLRALFIEEDQRRDITVGVSGGFYDASGSFQRLPQATSQNYTKKYITPVQLVNDSRANWKVIRYADVLLMYAEALNENGKTSEALAPLNAVRSRAGLSPYDLSAPDDIREKIYLERRMELAFEGHRWFDLLRTGRALDVLAPLGMQSFRVLFPIPLSQIQVINNPAIFPQNPGYN